MDNTFLHGLVKQAQGGDRAAFGEIYEQLVPQIYRYLYYRTSGNRELAEDLAEDVFVKVIERLDQYQDRGTPFISWVYRIAHNRLVDHFRAQPKQGTVSIDECYDLAEKGAEKSLDLTLTHNELAKALGKLTDDQRQVVVFRFLEDMTILQTGAAIGKSDAAVTKLQARGLMSLRRALSRTGLTSRVA